MGSDSGTRGDGNRHPKRVTYGRAINRLVACPCAIALATTTRRDGPAVRARQLDRPGMTTEVTPDALLIAPLDPASPTPLYHQLKEELRRIAKSLPAGAPMPSEAELMAQTGVSRATIRRAVTDLGHEGILRSRRGLGTFVLRPKVDEPLLVLQSFTEIVSALGRVPSTRVLSFARVRAAPEIADRLGLQPGAFVYALERIRSVDGVPCILEHQYLNAALVPGLTETDAQGSIYGVIEARFGIRLVDGVETIQAVKAPPEIASHLEIARGSPLLVTARVTLAGDGDLVEFVARYVRADMWSFTFRLGRSSSAEPLPVPAPVVPLARAAVSQPLPSPE